MSIYTIKIVGEVNDVAPVIDKRNIVVKTKYNGFRMMDDAAFTDWETMFIFPDNTKAEYFSDNFNSREMNEYQEGMLKEDYIFHIIHCTFPEPEQIYADQLHMEADFKPFKF